MFALMKLKFRDNIDLKGGVWGFWNVYHEKHIQVEKGSKGLIDWQYNSKMTPDFDTIINIKYVCLSVEFIIITTIYASSNY